VRARGSYCGGSSRRPQLCHVSGIEIDRDRLLGSILLDQGAHESNQLVTQRMLGAIGNQQQLSIVPGELFGRRKRGASPFGMEVPSVLVDDQSHRGQRHAGQRELSRRSADPALEAGL